MPQLSLLDDLSHPFLQFDFCYASLFLRVKNRALLLIVNTCNCVVYFGVPLYAALSLNFVNACH